MESRRHPLSPLPISPLALLSLGAILAALTQMRWGVSWLAWFAPIPWLYYLLHYRQWRHQGWLLLAITISSSLAVAKIVTPPISYGFVPLFALPMAIGLWLLFLLWSALRQRVGAAWGVYAFPALMVVAEWSQYQYSDFGSWGALANTQLDNLVLLQIVAVTGLAGIAWLISWGAVLAAEIWHSRSLSPWRWHLVAFILALAASHSYGTLRLDGEQPGSRVLTATIASKLIITDPQSPPDETTLQAYEADLLARSAKAAQHGAKVIVWNEAASIVTKSREPVLVEQVRTLARETQTHIVMAYAVPISTTPFLFENKYHWIRPDGTIAETYFKHHPVPGEGSVKGTEPLRAIDTEFGKVAGAICYDYDFPAMARQHGQLGVGLVVVPSSDWAGIDPIHTQMTRLRAIEGGFSVLRSVRSATAAGFDAHGRVRGWSGYFEAPDGILLTTLPVGQLPTLYRQWGDWLVYLSLGLLGVITALAWRCRSERITQ